MRINKTKAIIAVTLLFIMTAGMFFAIQYYSKPKNKAEVNAPKVVVSKEFTAYDKKTCSGSQIKKAMDSYMKDTFAVFVKTDKSDYYICYTDCNPYKVNDAADPNWIKDDGIFNTQLEFSYDGRVTGILFNQVKGK